ncbi:MAG: hypothetical protein SH868_02515 [Bythopirellula sp.]|nr:hypothetical protein [Bythopirellula sp.]
MHNYYVGRTQTDGSKSANAAWLPPTPGFRNWRTDMKPEDVAKFEAAAGNLLDDLGYETGSVAISGSVRQHVAKIREQFFHDAEERKWRLPTIW